MQGNGRQVCFIYIRLSLQGETGESLDRQLEICKARATAEGWRYEIYKEPPGLRSGYYEHRRPEWQRMNRDLLARDDVAAVIVADLARASRNAIKSMDFVFRLYERGITVISLKENIDPATAMGRAFIGMTAVFNQLYRDDISERKDRQYSNRDPNIYASNVHPFGMTRTGKYPEILWKPNADFPIVVKLFELYADGVGAPTIADELRALGYTWVNRKQERSEINRYSVQRAVNRVERYRPFLGEDLYTRVVLMRDSKRTHPRSVRQTKRPPLVLRGLLVCRHCCKRFKAATQIHTSKGSEYEYRIYIHPFTECHAPNGQRRTRHAEFIHDLFFEKIKRLEEVPLEDMERMARAIAGESEGSTKAAENRLARKKLETRLRNFEQMRADGDITLARFREVKQEIEGALAALPVEVQPLRSPISFEDAMLLLRELPRALRLGADIDPERTNATLHTLIEQVEFDGERQVRVKWKEPFNILELEF